MEGPGLPTTLFLELDLFRVCLVGERSGMECHDYIPSEWVGSVPVFG